MSQFEFVLIPVGIVIGLAIAMVLQSWGAVINYSFRETKPSLFFSATGLVLLLVLLNFSGLWSYREITFAFPGGPLVFLLPFLLILPVLLMFLALAIVVPQRVEASRDFEQHYFFVSQKFFAVLGLGMLSSNIPDLIPGVGWTMELALQAPGPLLCLAAAATKRRAVHIIVHGLLWLMFLIGYGNNFLEYLIFLER